MGLGVAQAPVEATKFDLNIEQILENWETHHAIREIIANAMDEEVLSATEPIRIFEKDEAWHIRDFGRGLSYKHLTQKENDEKLNDARIIGKFGIGLKDALATFDRKGIKVVIRSRHGDVTLAKSEKHGFSDLPTLHAYIHPPSDPSLQGTDFVLSGCTGQDVETAKDLFLRFSGERVLEATSDGQVLAKKGRSARIYVNGVKVAEEENFLFSYNITAVNKAIRRALNRERTNVGRTAYSDRVKSILLACKQRTIANALVEDLNGYQAGTSHDELNWVDVSTHAVKLLNSLEKVVFFTPEELVNAAPAVDKARSDGYRIVTIPATVKAKIHGAKDVTGSAILDLEQFQRQWNDSFEFKFVTEESLSASERRVFAQTESIMNLAGGRPRAVLSVRISETMRADLISFREALGLWDPQERQIVIKRTQLRSLESYAGTLLHELCHATSGAPDISDRFEHELTQKLGTVAARALGQR